MKKSEAIENFPKISDLDHLQKARMAFLLDSETYCGYLTASQICRGELEEYNSLTIDKIFESFDLKPQKANDLARNVDQAGKHHALNSTSITQLKDEFAKLGFDIENIDLDKRLIVIDGFFQLNLTYSVTDPSISAEYFSVFFSGRLHDMQKPVIEVINAQLYNEAADYKKNMKADLSYYIHKHTLPNREEILKALSISLRVKNTIEKFGLTGSEKNEIKNQLKNRRGL